MKTLLTSIILLLSLTLYSQNIGDSYKYLFDNKDSLNITQYRVFEDYFEVGSFDEHRIAIFLIDFKHEKVIGIDYLYPDVDSRNKNLSVCLNDAYGIGEQVYVKDNTIIFISETEIIIRDVGYIKRRAKSCNKD